MIEAAGAPSARKQSNHSFEMSFLRKVARFVGLGKEKFYKGLDLEGEQLLVLRARYLLELTEDALPQATRSMSSLHQMVTRVSYSACSHHLCAAVADPACRLPSRLAPVQADSGIRSHPPPLRLPLRFDSRYTPAPCPNASTPLNPLTAASQCNGTPGSGAPASSPPRCRSSQSTCTGCSACRPTLTGSSWSTLRRSEC